MFKNYFKIITRNLWRNKLYAIINIFGLGIGIAALVWGFQTYRFSHSFNDFHKNGQSIFRVVTKADGNDNLKGIVPMPLAMLAKNDFANIQQAIRWDSRGLDIKAEGNEPFATQTHFTDPGFFDLFNFPLLKGTINLNDRSTVLITEKAAKKFFGNADPIGKTLMFYADEPIKKPLTVTGILKDPPMNSSFQFEVITHFDNQYKLDGSLIKPDDWAWFVDAIFFKLNRPQESGDLAVALKKYLPLQREVGKDIKLSAFIVEPLSQVANHDRDLDSNGLMERPEDSAALGPLVLAILILLSACLNFANTSVAQSSRRLKEMGVRKMMGSTFRQIMLQQLLECAAIVLLAIGLSVVINTFWLPAFNAMFVFVNVTANYFTDYALLALLGLILVSVTLLAGGYPAFYISRFNASNIFRGNVKFGGNNLFSRLLLGFQIIISFITVIAGVAFSRNSEFQRTYDFGYDKNNVIGVNLQDRTVYNALYNELKKTSGIASMGGTREQVGFNYRNVPLKADGFTKPANIFETGENYLEVMRLKLTAGRSFNTPVAGSNSGEILINEKLAFNFGWTPAEAIGKQVRSGDTSVSTVVGVLKDFTQNDLFESIGPVAIKLIAPEKYSQLIIRAKPGELTKVYDQTKTVWSKLFPMKPFRAYYQDQVAAEAAQTNASIATIFFWFAIISMLMAGTGMFALVSLSIMKKLRQIAIRKVVGAKTSHIAALILKGYLWIFILAAIAGCYAGLALSKLLMDMIFKINSGVTISSLILSFICVLLISAITIGSRIRYAGKQKAIELLKAN